jgi:hypothetical protein
VVTVAEAVRRVRPIGHLPLWLKAAFTLFMCVMVPFYWRSYGPTNFLYLCDVAMFFTLAALWLESPLLASMPTVGILVPQMIWVIDFALGSFGVHFLGLTDYMFDNDLPLFTRALSSFHGWLPFLLLWMTYRLGYARRALPAWTILTWALLLVCYFLMPAPPAPADDRNRPVNINYVYGFGDKQAQTWLPEGLYFALWMVALPVAAFLPAHLFLRKLFPVAGVQTDLTPGASVELVRFVNTDKKS